MKNQKGLSVVLIQVIIVVILIILFVGGYFVYQRYFVQLYQPKTQTLKYITVSTLQCGTMNIEMPKDYMNLSWPQNEQLDERGCFRDLAGGCSCLRINEETGLRSVFSTIETSNADYEIPKEIESVEVKTQYLKNLVSSIKETLKNTETLTDEHYATFQGYPSASFNINSPNNGVITINRNIFFSRDSKVYNITFLADRNSFNKYWPKVETSVNNLTFTK